MRQRIFELTGENRIGHESGTINLLHDTHEARNILTLSILDKELLAFFHELPYKGQVRVTFEVVESE